VHRVLKFLLILMLIPSVCFGGASRDFDGDDDKITMPDGETIINDEPFTILCWLFLDAFSPDAFPGAWQIDTDLDDSGTMLMFANNDAGSYDGINFGSGGGSSRFARVVTSTFDGASLLGVWTHIAYVYDGLNDGIESSYTLYLNGVLEATEDQGAGYAGTVDNDNRVGRASTVNTFWNGKLAYFQLNKIEMTIEQVNQNMNFPGTTTEAILMFLPFWDDGLTEFDLSGNGNDGIVTGAAPFSDGPPVAFGKGLPL